MATLIWSGLKNFLTSRKNTKLQTCKSPHKNRVKTKEKSGACVAWEKEHPAKTSVKFPHGYYDMQAAIQMFHQTLLAHSCHYIRPTPLICTSNKNLISLNLCFIKICGKYISLKNLFVSNSGDVNIVFMYLNC